MSIPILATKISIPPPRPKVVLRPRLIELLNEGLQRTPGVTLISAPVGYGKTTLVSEWVACCERPVAWLSLDKGDSDPRRFLAYFVAALQTLVANTGAGVLNALQAPQLPLIESVLTGLLNEIAAFPYQFTLVLDDYHLIDSQPIDQALTFLIEHMPSQMHLVITTREDPNLPLARLRARGQLTELRAADLRFTPAETAEFLKRVMGLNLAADDIATLEIRTEGWIAGLQLAALSTRGREDVHGFIKAFAGDNLYIVDYLVEELLQRQPERVRNFLLQTSILDWLSGPLCDAVTGQQEGKVLLEILERGNLFVSALDDKRHWFRYHHLFTDVLHIHLMAEQPDQVPALHRRASEWYERNGSPADAIRHALAAEDFERAADLVERAFPAMSRSRQEATLLGWLRVLPEALVYNRPVLCNLYAGALMQTGEMEGVDAWLRAAERWLIPTGEGRELPGVLPSAMVVVDQEEFRRLPGAVAMHRAGQALMLGNVDETIKHARRVLDLAPEDDFLRRGGAAALQGLAFWTIGDLEAARRMYPEGIVSLQRAGHLADSTGCALALADIVIAQGYLHEAMGIYEQSLRLASERGEPNLRGTADMLVGMSELYYERNDLNAATLCLLRGKEQGEHTGLPQNRYRWRVAMARIREKEGDLNGALDLLDEAERLFMSDFSPNVRPIAAIKARLYAAHGRLGEALDWAREQGLSAEDNLNYLREFEHITLARVMFAQYQRDRADSLIREAIGFLERLLKAAQEGGRTGSVIEILILQALAHQAEGDIPAALMPLHQALTLAKPEGYVRIFLDEGQSMAQLLREAAAHEIMPDYTGKLLDAIKSGQQPVLPTGHRDDGADRQAGHGRSEDKSLRSDWQSQSSPTSQSLIEPLSQRELEILRLFKTELSGPEIARELVIALSTVRTHTKSIYSKLNVNNRRAAVKRAAELGLI